MSRCFGRDRQRVRHAIEHMDESPIGAPGACRHRFPIGPADGRLRRSASVNPPATRSTPVSDRDFCAGVPVARFDLRGSPVSPRRGNRHLVDAAIRLCAAVGCFFHRLLDSCRRRKNPDAAELVRAKTGRIKRVADRASDHHEGAFPLAYSKDMQEDKEQVFDAAESLELSLAAMTGMVRDMEIRADQMRKAAGSGYSTAPPILPTGLSAKRDCRSAMPTTATGHAVAMAEEKGCELAELPLEDLQGINPAITEGIFDVLSSRRLRCQPSKLMAGTDTFPGPQADRCGAPRLNPPRKLGQNRVHRAPKTVCRPPRHAELASVRNSE